MSGAGDTARFGVDDHSTAGTAGSDAWTRLTSAASAERFAAVWLEILGAELTGVRRAVVVLRDKERGPYAPVAVWPAGVSGSRPLVEAVEQAIRQRAAVQWSGKAGSPDTARTYDLVATPVTVNDTIYGATAFEIEHDPERDLAAVIAAFKWRCTWLEAFIRGHWTAPSDRLITVLETVATSVHHQRFQEAVTAVATELAGRLGCERVCIGFLKGRHAEVRGVSHSATFGKKVNLIRAIEAAMDEAIDQQASIVYPAPKDAPLQVTRAHGELHEGHGKAEIATVPFSDGAALLGAITLERPSDEPFDDQTLRLCEHAASLLGPILDVKRKDDRWLLVKAFDSAAAQLRSL
ncbi:MAG TPA: GAF domain-containing protein, partial [Gammaproteobacteria bacterium]|nr:GAF domain-containing protein [Gammaproteobacteria bacterium]